MNRSFKLAIALSLSLLVGCASFPAKSTFESKNPSPGIRLEIGEESEGRALAQISIPAFPEAHLFGLAQKDSAGNWKVSLTTLKWFNNWPNGWTDAEFLLEGGLRFEKSAEGWVVGVETPPSMAVVDKATLRYFDTFFLGDKATEQFSRRWDRVQAVTDVLAAQFPEGWIGDTDKVGKFLFPELHGYENGERPGETKVVDSVAWDTTYTAKHFPENLRPLRDSGTMLRDWQESRGLWTLAYQWKTFWQHVESVVLMERR